MKMTKKKAYAMLAFSIVMELIASANLEACEAFTKPVPTVIMIVGYILAFGTFSKTLRVINLSIGYATWTAVGSVGASLLGIFLFDQIISPVGWGAILVMVASVFVLNLYGTPKKDEEREDGEEKC